MAEKDNKNRLPDAQDPVGILPPTYVAEEAIRYKPTFNQAAMEAAKTIDRDGAITQAVRQAAAEQEESGKENEPDAQDPVRHGMEAAYSQRAADYDSMLSSLEARAAEARQKNDAYQKGARSRAVISGIGEAVSSLANLIGVGNWASNQKPGKVTSSIVGDAERARMDYERKIDDINDRLDRLRDNESEMRLAMSLGLTRYDAERRARQDAADAAAAAAAREDAKWLAEQERRRLEHEDEMQIARQKETRLEQEGKAKAANEAEEARQRKEVNIAKANNSRWGDMIPVDVLSEDGRGTEIVDIGEAALEEAYKGGMQDIRDDIAREYFGSGSDYSTYLKLKNGNRREYRRWKKENPEADEILSGLDAYDEDEVVALAREYAKRSPTLSGRLRRIAAHQAGHSSAPVREGADNDVKGGPRKSNFDGIF